MDQQSNPSKLYGISILEALVWVPIYLLAAFIAFVLINKVAGFSPEDSSWVLSFIVAMPLLSVIYLAKRRYETDFTFTPPHFAPQLIGWGVIIILLLNLGLSCLLNLIPGLTESMSSIESSAQSGFGAIVAFVLLAPLLEELFFRGLLQPNLLKANRLSYAILIQAIAFSLIHMNAFQFFTTLPMGILLGYLAWRSSGSLLVPIVVHFVNNAISVFAMNQFSTEGSLTDVFPAWQILTIGVVAITFAIGAWSRLHNKTSIADNTIIAQHVR